MASKIQNGGKFSMGCNFFLLIIFSIALLHCVCVKNGKNMKKKFILSQDGALARGVGQKWFFCYNFGSMQLFFNLFFALDLYN
jgi:hypothetical protein